MKNRSHNIALLILFILIAGIIYLTFSLDEKPQYEISSISLEGNKHLSKEEYLNFSGLVDPAVFNNLSLRVIRDRLQRHPYLSKVIVEYTGNGTVSINIEEKKFRAHILTENNKYLLSGGVEVLPLLENTHNLDYPIVRIDDSEELENFEFPKANIKIERSFKILSAAKMLNPDLYANLSEVDLRNGENIIIYFSSVDYPVILGGENEIKKMIVFEKLWESLSTVQASKLLDYVDLRFTNKVYLGIAGEQIQAEDTQS